MPCAVLVYISPLWRCACDSLSRVAFAASFGIPGVVFASALWMRACVASGLGARLSFRAVGGHIPQLAKSMVPLFRSAGSPLRSGLPCPRSSGLVSFSFPLKHKDTQTQKAGQPQRTTKRGCAKRSMRIQKEGSASGSVGQRCGGVARCTRSMRQRGAMPTFAIKPWRQRSRTSVVDCPVANPAFAC